METTSVLIVGGGPAGLAAAIALRQRGIDCTVVEAQSAGTDKACGEGLMPGALAALAALGVNLDAAGPCFRGIRFSDLTHRVDADFKIGPGIGVRRPELHSRLAERASALGAELHWNSRVRLLKHPDSSHHSDEANGLASIDGRTIRFRWLIGADGQASTVRKWAGLDAWRSERVRFGFRRHYNVRPWSEFVEVHWAREGQIYITPVSADSVCLVAMSHNHRTVWEDFLTGFPEIEARLQGADLTSQPRGARSAMRRLHRVANERVALIGDASGSADSITGEGLAMSFLQASALADAVAKGSLSGYERSHRSIGRKPHWMGGLMLTLDRWPALVSPTLSVLAGAPGLFGMLLNLSAGGSARRSPHPESTLVAERSALDVEQTVIAGTPLTF